MLDSKWGRCRHSAFKTCKLRDGPIFSSRIRNFCVLFAHFDIARSKNFRNRPNLFSLRYDWNLVRSFVNLHSAFSNGSPFSKIYTLGGKHFWNFEQWKSCKMQRSWDLGKTCPHMLARPRRPSRAAGTYFNMVRTDLLETDPLTLINFQNLYLFSRKHLIW